MFKRAITYILPKEASEQDLISRVVETDSNSAFERFTECTEQQPLSIGFIPAITGSDSLIYRHEDSLLMRLQIQTKTVPTHVIKKGVEEWARIIRADEDRNPTRKELVEIREHLIFHAMKVAFPKDRIVPVIITGKYMIIDAPPGAADMVQSLFRMCLGSLPVQNGAELGDALMDKARQSIILEDEPMAGFTFRGDYKLAGDEVGTITVRENTSTDMFAEHASGRDLKSIGLSTESMAFMLTGFNLSSIRFAPEFLIKISREDCESDAEFEAATFILVSRTIVDTIEKLHKEAGE